jgi:hypothetical protein
MGLISGMPVYKHIQKKPELGLHPLLPLGKGERETETERENS